MLGDSWEMLIHADEMAELNWEPKGEKKKGRRTGSESVKPLVDKCSTYDPIIWSRMEEIEE